MIKNSNVKRLMIFAVLAAAAALVTRYLLQRRNSRKS